jgi:hypothetical protein
MKNRIDWHAWKTHDFQINFDHQFNHSDSTCGGCCVSMLTGERPAVVDRKAKWGGDCKTGIMIRMLEKRKFDVMPLSPRTVCNTLFGANYANPTLTDEHIILFGSMTDRLDASWFLFHAGAVWHNFERWTDSPLFLLCNPAEDVLLIRK